MQLRLSQLRREAERAAERGQATAELREALKRAFGPSLPVRGTLNETVTAAHRRLDALEFSGGVDGLGIRQSLLLRFVDDRSASVRRLAARLLPERLSARLQSDPDEGVRHAVAGRVGTAVLCEMVKRDPEDDVLRNALRQRRLDEAGTKRAEEPSTRLTGDAVKQADGPELSDVYYETMAERLMQDFGRRMEFGWEREAVRRLASSTRATSGVVLDEERLLEALDDLIEARDDAALERADKPLREAATYLRRRALAETSVMPIIEDDTDPVAALDENDPSFMEEAMHVFSIRESFIPAALRKHRLREGVLTPLRVPVSGRLPSGRAPRAIDERMLDALARKWNERATMSGEPVRVRWSPSGHMVDGITFSAELR